MVQIKRIRITYPECMFASLRIQGAVRMRHVVICCLTGSNTFPHIILQTTQLSPVLSPVPLHFPTLSHKPHNYPLYHLRSTTFPHIISQTTKLSPEPSPFHYISPHYLTNHTIIPCTFSVPLHFPKLSHKPHNYPL